MYIPSVCVDKKIHVVCSDVIATGGMYRALGWPWAMGAHRKLKYAVRILNSACRLCAMRMCNFESRTGAIQ